VKITDHIKAAKGRTLFSIEILPPQKGKTLDDLQRVIEPLMEFQPPFIDVTYHKEEVIYKKRADGLIEEVPLRKRPGTVGICAALQGKFSVDTVPHLVCGGFTKEETEDALFTLHYLGIDNLLLLTGDKNKGQKKLDASIKSEHQYASDLVAQVALMNKGKFLHEETENELKTEFCIGVAGYPEKHFEAPNLKTDLKHLKEKVDAGADYIVTQFFFDNKYFFDFERRCREIGINIPIIPGLKPIYRRSQLRSLPSMFHVTLPDILVDELDKAKDDKQAREIGVKWCIAQSQELKAAGVPVLHYYTMSRSSETVEIARAVF
jgi:methylenetetrahydrofolate reductase (NADPH)